MHDDDPDDDLFEGQQSYGNLPAFDIEELSETAESACVHVEEKTIQSMGEIVAIADKHNLNVYMEACVVMEVGIESASIDISFDFSTFKERIHCKNGVFRGKLTVWNAIFEQEVDFDGAIFEEDVGFESCMFAKGVSFFGASFEKEVSFRSCEFEGEATFDNASFAGKVDFTQSSFKKKVTCHNAVFNRTVDLSDSIFEQGLESIDSNLPDMKKDDLAGLGGHEQRSQQRPRKTSPSNPWRILDKGLDKRFSRRQLLRGIFKFLPRDRDK